jgi:hypothetical protein
MRVLTVVPNSAVASLLLNVYRDWFTVLYCIYIDLCLGRETNILVRCSSSFKISVSIVVVRCPFSMRWSSSPPQFHGLVQRRALVVWLPTDWNCEISNAVWCLNENFRTLYDMFVRGGDFENVCFKVNGWKHLKHVNANMTVFRINGCLYILYFNDFYGCQITWLYWKLGVVARVFSIYWTILS